MNKNAETASFLAFFTLIIGPGAYRKLTALVESEDPKEYVLDEVIGMGIAISGVYIFTSYFQCGPEGVSNPKSSLEIATNGLIKELQKH